MSKYRELGELLIHWREEKYRSARAFSQNADFSFGYNRYYSFEKGTQLPSLEQIVEIAEFLGKDPLDAAILWARIQMPTETLKECFQPRRFVKEKEQRRKSGTESPNSDNTWIMSPGDAKLLIKHPWLGDFLLCLVNCNPEEVKFEQLDLKGLEPDDFTKKYIQLWVDNGYVTQTKTGYKVAKPHIDNPHFEECNIIAKNNFLRASQYLAETVDLHSVEQELAFRMHMTRNLSEGQYKRWHKKLQALMDEFVAEPFEAVDKKELFSDMHILMLGLAKRDPTKGNE